MTGRGRWLLLIALIGLLLGMVRKQHTLAAFSSAVFFWILFQWVLFQWYSRFGLPQIKVERSVNDRRKDEDTLWAGRKATIELRVDCPVLLRPTLELRDVVPELFGILIRPELREKLIRNDGLDSKKRGLFSPIARSWAWLTSDASAEDEALPPNEHRDETSKRSIRFLYSVRPRAAGVAELPGVRVTLRDRFGFFRQHRLVACKQLVRVLPTYYQGGERLPTVKRHNSLPRHGIHRLQRAGVGSELLELREYVPGDPPKSIAWKVSARRDVLMTRQYESEVPVRVSLLLDGSISTRLGGYGLRLMDQLNYVAASVAKTALSVGDPVKATLIDEVRTRRVAWLSGDRGFLQLLRELADFSNAPPPPSQWLNVSSLECAEAICRERYPGLLERRYRVLPFSFFGSLRRRMRVAAVMSELHGLSPKEQYDCYYDGGKFAIQLRRFLHDAGYPWMPPLIASTRVGNASAALNMRMLSEELSQEVALARDNQVFVILADVLSSGPYLNELIQSMKLALARHHRVVFVCPATTFRRPDTEIVRPKSDSVEDLLAASEQSRIRDISEQLRRDLSRLGVAVSFSGEKEAIKTVINEIEATRSGGSRAGAASMGGAI